jgi:hypothetical protein
MVAALIVAPDVFARSKSGGNPQYQEYRRQVDRETAKAYRENKQTIDPGGQRGKAQGYDLDHKRSVKDCYRSGVSAKACGSAENLQVVPKHQNRSEGCKTPGCRNR